MHAAAADNCNEFFCFTRDEYFRRTNILQMDSSVIEIIDLTLDDDSDDTFSIEDLELAIELCVRQLCLTAA